MSFLNVPPLTLRNAGRLLVIIVLALVTFAIVLALLRVAMPGTDSRSPWKSAMEGPIGYSGGYSGGNVAYDSVQNFQATEYGAGKATAPVSAPSLRNVADVAAEAATIYEARAYRASIRTSSLDTACGTIAGWRSESYVQILEERKDERSCFVHFKVERAESERMLASLRALSPYELVSEAETIKEEVVDYTARTAVLEERQKLLEEALLRATQAYDDLATQATAAGDVETLTKVVEGKLTQTERLIRDRAAVAAELERLSREKSAALDRVDFVHFIVSVERLQVIDGEELRMSWMYRLEQFAREVNRSIQDLTLGLVTDMLRLAIAVVYILLLIGVIKFFWPHVRPHAERARSLLATSAPTPAPSTEAKVAPVRAPRSPRKSAGE